MSKRRNRPVPGYFKISGKAVENPDGARRAKQQLDREAAERSSRAGRKTPLGAAPAAQRAEDLPGAKPQPGAIPVPQKRKKRAPGEGAERRMRKAKHAHAPAQAAPKTTARRAPPAAGREPAPEGREAGGGGRIRRFARLVRDAAGHAMSIGRAAVDLWRHRHDHEPGRA
jgi:hypothetical protein